MVSYLLLYLAMVSCILQISYTGLFTCSSTLCWPLYLLGYLTLVSFSLLYLVLVFLPYLMPFTGLFPTSIPCVDLSTSIPYSGLFLTPLPCAGLLPTRLPWLVAFSLLYLVLVSYLLLYLVLVSFSLPTLWCLFNYSYTVHWSLSYSSTHCAGLFTYSYTLH